MTIISFCSKRKSIILEEDLNYRNEMECSVFDRLRQFKESESKKKEDLQVWRFKLLPTIGFARIWNAKVLLILLSNS